MYTDQVFRPRKNFVVAQSKAVNSLAAMVSCSMLHSKAMFIFGAMQEDLTLWGTAV